MSDSNFTQYFRLALIIIVAVLLRIYFHIGHIFSDDAYYSYLSYSFFQGNLTNEYIGYPIFPLRVAFIGLTAVSLMIFGNNEFATLLFPLFFSIINIILTFKLVQLITVNNNKAFISAILIAFFPTDVIFASICFPDLINTFFINLGIYLLLKSYYQNKNSFSYFGGLSLLISMQFKENIYYALILLLILLFYLLVKNKHLNFQLIVGILFIIGNYLIEGLAYLLLHNDFLYRITITNLNYQYSFYDFFPFTAQKLSGSIIYLRNLFNQIFLINAKSVFFRRFYLFIPMIAAFQTFLNFKTKEYKLLLFWFWGTAILLMAFTTSFTEYKPLDLTRSWYVYPLLMPMIILSAIFIDRFTSYIKIPIILIYTVGSLIMCFEYESFFDKNNLNSLKTFLRDNPTKFIYTDHFTKYSVDLIRNYESSKSERILGKEYDLASIKQGEWILLNQKHIEELQMQNHGFPDFSILNSQEFKKVAKINDYIFYEKVH
jgi:4-amino-4-deoxy-L-arabinose transferase-like glycosyltransferase